MSRWSWPSRLLLGLLLAFLFFFGGEILLRGVGFHYQRSLSYMEFNFPNPHELHEIFVPDPELLWRMRPGFNFGQGFPPLNSQGFRGPEFKRKKTRGVLRVACLGDSVTFGRPEASFPALLEFSLTAKLSQRVEVMNFGVPGYSSWQGRRLLSWVLREYQPEVVIILFGWNDHWLARGFADKEQRPADSPVASFLQPLRGLRLYQLLNWMVAKLREELSPPPTLLRVSKEDYEANLLAMVQECEKNSARPVLATAPSGLGLAPPPDFLTQLEFVKDKEEVAKLHEEFNQVVREVAKKAGVAFVDLDAWFEKRGRGNFFDHPDQDVIHPNAAGYKLMAQALTPVILSELAKMRWPFLEK